MIGFLLLGLPLVLGLGAEYALCRFPRRRLWRWAGPIGLLLLTGVVGLFRYHGWSAGEEKAPWETLLFLPGLPALGAGAGLCLGWRLWQWLWLPRVVKDKRRRE